MRISLYLNDEFDLKQNDNENIKEVRKKEVERKLEFRNRIIPHRGHTVWKFDTKTNELSECIFTDDSKEIHWSDAVKKDYTKKNKKVVTEENCIYFNALNRENAYKVLRRDFNITV